MLARFPSIPLVGATPSAVVRTQIAITRNQSNARTPQKYDSVSAAVQRECQRAAIEDYVPLVVVVM
jgi:hypothetical protein